MFDDLPWASMFESAESWSAVNSAKLLSGGYGLSIGNADSERENGKRFWDLNVFVRGNMRDKYSVADFRATRAPSPGPC